MRCADAGAVMGAVVVASVRMRQHARNSRCEHAPDHIHTQHANGVAQPTTTLMQQLFRDVQA